MENKKLYWKDNVKATVDASLGYPIIFVDMPEMSKEQRMLFRGRVAKWVAEQINGMTKYRMVDCRLTEYDPLSPRLLAIVDRLTCEYSPVSGLDGKAVSRFKELCREYQLICKYLVIGMFPVPGYAFYPDHGFGPLSVNCINAALTQSVSMETVQLWDARCKIAYKMFADDDGYGLKKYGCLIQDNLLGYPIYYVSLDPDEFDVRTFFGYHSPSDDRIGTLEASQHEASHIIKMMRVRNLFVLDGHDIGLSIGPKYLADIKGAVNFSIASESRYFSQTYEQGLAELSAFISRKGGPQSQSNAEEDGRRQEVLVHARIGSQLMHEPSIYLPCELMDKEYDPGYEAPGQKWNSRKLPRYMDIMHAIETVYHNDGRYNEPTIFEMSMAIKMLVEKNAILLNPTCVEVEAYKAAVLPLLTPADHRMAEFLMSTINLVEDRVHGIGDVRIPIMMNPTIKVGDQVRLDMVQMSQHKNELSSLAKHVAENIKYSPEVFTVKEIRPGKNGSLRHHEYRLDRFLCETWLPDTCLVKVKQN